MSEQRRPLTLLKRLEKRVGKELDTDYHLFRGMNNPDSKCYIIALLQLFFHSSDFLEYITSDTELNECEKLLKEIYNDLYSADTKSIDITNFITNWKGWIGRNTGFPSGFQDILEFFLFFTNTLSDDLRSYFCFEAIQKNGQKLKYNFLPIIINSPNLRQCVTNAENNFNEINGYPPLLFIQLDRAFAPQKIVSDYITINKTITFNSQFYSFIGGAVFENESHYHSIIKIHDEYFDFNDNDVSPLFLDDYSVMPSSYKRCLNCDSFLHRNTVLFLYELTDHDDLSLIHLSPKIQKMMSNDKKEGPILQIHENNSDSDEKYLEISNNELFRDVVNVANIEDNDLKGTVKINLKGIPPNVIQPIKNNRFIKYRKIFKWISNILRELKEFDQGKLNAELLLHKLEFESEEKEFVQVQGCILYDIITNRLLEKENVTFKDVKNELQIIVDSYEAKYSPLLEDIKSFPKVFQDSDKCFDDDESEQLTDLTIFNNKNKSDSSDDSYDSEDDIKFKNGSGLTLNENESVRIWKTTTNSFENLSLNFSNDIKFEDDECPNVLDQDDNQFLLKDYCWKERAEILNADIILKEIRKKIKEKYNKRKYVSLDSKSGLRKAIKFEVQREWKNAIKRNSELTIASFAREWIKNNVTSSTKHVLVQTYNNLIEEENMRKEENSKRKKKKLEKSRIEDDLSSSLFDLENEHNNNPFEEYIDGLLNSLYERPSSFQKSKDFSVDENTIKHWIEEVNRKKKNQNENQNDSLLKNKSGWGGPHNTKLTDDALLCLICLALDFPNMSAKHFASYLNSKYGPCCDEKKHVKQGTVSRALRSLEFSIKKAAFCPPARNTIGLRIFRVAWSLLVDEISNKDEVLMCFIDEAAVSVIEGRKYGRAFVGITPLINSPLSNCKVTVLSCVIPGYGVLYKFFDSAVHGKDYASFLKDITNFMRIYICSSNTQIVLIEDNCKIHCTTEVEDIINGLKIAVIPTVPYSPALNGVVEGYFGFIKSAHLEFYSFESSEEPSCDEEMIRETWEKLSTERFNVEIGDSLYAEWKARMALCVEGIPLVSGHINADTYENDAQRLLTVKVFRHYKEIEYI